MKNINYFLFVLIFLSARPTSHLLAGTQYPDAQNQHVIFITIDGIRYQEMDKGINGDIFIIEDERLMPHDLDLVPTLSSLVKEKQAFYFPRMKIANNMAISLPAYYSMFTGTFEYNCQTNHCDQVEKETLFDRLMNEGLNPSEVAAFGSWGMIQMALESKTKRMTRNIAFDSFSDESLDPYGADAERIIEINKHQLESLPHWKGSRFDQWTYDLGLMFLKNHQPRLLYLQLEDADELAHWDKYKLYLLDIKKLDTKIKKIQKMLSRMGEYGKNTSIVITTDHGRGFGDLWTKHFIGLLGSSLAWSIVIPAKNLLPQLEKFIPNKTDHQIPTHLDIRPTIEFLMGLKPIHDDLHKGIPLVRKRKK